VDVFHFLNGQPPRRLEQLEKLPDEGLIWLDWVRDHSEGWEKEVHRLLAVEIVPSHGSDARNGIHPSYFDGTADYDMLIFEGLGSSDQPFPLETRVAAFFLFDRMLVTVRAEDNVSFGIVKRKLLEGRYKAPGSIVKLVHRVLDTMVDRFLRIRDPLDRRLTRQQDDLLDPANPVNDWRELLNGRRVVRQLESLAESQLEALDAWQRGTRFEWDQIEEIHVRDLEEHIHRILTHASGQERDVEAAVQLHFASMSHRTNRVVQGLTVMSAIFFPLTLITGIYGMNFDNMPELHTRYGYLVVLVVLAVLGGGLALYFRRRNFL
jgi:magnesium/cobalt transport protein CorA